MSLPHPTEPGYRCRGWGSSLGCVVLSVRSQWIQELGLRAGGPHLGVDDTGILEKHRWGQRSVGLRWEVHRAWKQSALLKGSGSEAAVERAFQLWTHSPLVSKPLAQHSTLMGTAQPLNIFRPSSSQLPPTFSQHHYTLCFPMWLLRALKRKKSILILFMLWS